VEVETSPIMVALLTEAEAALPLAGASEAVVDVAVVPKSRTSTQGNSIEIALQ